MFSASIFKRLAIASARTHAVLAALVAVLGTAGCGNANLPTTVPVSGRITFDGGPCPAGGNIRFAPLEVAEGLPNRPGRADFDISGKYIARSFQDGDGLVPGKYRVLVECWKVVPVDGKPGVSYIASGYKPSELVVDRKSDSLTYDFNVPKAK
jgi:hypothetical protein